MTSSDAAWGQQIGAALSERGAAELLGVPTTEVRERRGLLRIRNRDGAVVYPLVQFADGAPLPGVADVVAAFAPAVATQLTIASWLTAPNRALDGARPVEILRAGDVRRVVVLAKQAAASMRS